MFRIPRTNPQTADSPLPAASNEGPPAVVESSRFALELAREISRSNRRQFDPEFGLIQIRFDTPAVDAAFFQSPLFQSWQIRLRIADTIGWYDDSLAVLLPETDKDGTMIVANELTRLAVTAGVTVNTEVSIFPDDDQLVSTAIDAQHRKGPRKSAANDHDPPHQRPNGWHIRSRDASLKADASADPNGESTLGVVLKSDPAHGRVLRKPHAFTPVRPTPWWKRAVDVFGAGIGLVLLSPLFVVAAVAIRISSPGPVFFRQLREGRSGKPFGMLKFRTMVVGAESGQGALRDRSEQDGPAFKMKDDPRLTTVGKYLRRSCVDELPQLINVLRGDMSLVGPRPLPVGESRACTVWQRTRLSVIPGLTCIWQTRSEREVSFAEWMRMDLDYIQRQSFWVDLKLIFKTAWIAILHRGSV